MVNNTTATLRIGAACATSYPSYEEGTQYHYNQPQSFAVRAETDDAAAIVALFPKSCGLRVGSLSLAADGRVISTVIGYADLLPSKTNKGVNEAGVARYYAIKRAAAKLGIQLVWSRYAAVGSLADSPLFPQYADRPASPQSYETMEAFEAALEAAK